jgi:hypothetical protein
MGHTAGPADRGQGYLGDSGRRYIASVLLAFDNADYLSNGWVDLHTLLRIDGAWKIMNKTATHCSRAAWGRFDCVSRTRSAGLSRGELDERHQCVVELSLTRRRASRAWPGAASRSLTLAGSEHD